MSSISGETGKIIRKMYEESTQKFNEDSINLIVEALLKKNDFKDEWIINSAREGIKEFCNNVVFGTRIPTDGWAIEVMNKLKKRIKVI